MLGFFERRGKIGILRIDNPPVNAISVGVREAIIHGVQQLQEDAALKAAVLICAGRTFMAGADITEFGKTPLEPGLQKAIDALEQSKKLVVAAIHGTAFGGGRSWRPTLLTSRSTRSPRPPSVLPMWWACTSSRPPT